MHHRLFTLQSYIPFYPFSSVGGFRECDILTVEIEHVNASSLQEVSQELGIPVHPSPSTLATIQVIRD